MDGNALIGQYRAVLSAAQHMLNFARKNAWGDVSKTAIAIGGMTDRLRSIKASEVLSTDEMTERGEILAELVRIDGEIRQLREPWLRTMDGMLDSGKPRKSRNPLSAIALDLGED